MSDHLSPAAEPTLDGIAEELRRALAQVAAAQATIERAAEYVRLDEALILAKGLRVTLDRAISDATTAGAVNMLVDVSAEELHPQLGGMLAAMAKDVGRRALDGGEAVFA